eukprot:1159843-Pelagomonas_calceolata.AAC.4
MQLVPGYRDEIAEPMDLGTVSSNLAANVYSSPQQVVICSAQSKCGRCERGYRCMIEGGGNTCVHPSACEGGVRVAAGLIEAGTHALSLAG